MTVNRSQLHTFHGNVWCNKCNINHCIASRQKLFVYAKTEQVSLIYTAMIGSTIFLCGISLLVC